MNLLEYVLCKVVKIFFSPSVVLNEIFNKKSVFCYLMYCFFASCDD